MDTVLLMMLLPAGACIVTGIILQIIAASKKKRGALGPVLIAAGIIFAVVTLVTVMSLR